MARVDPQPTAVEQLQSPAGAERPSRRARLVRSPWTWVVATVLVVTLATGVWWWRGAHQGPPPLTKADVDKAVAAGIEKAAQQARQQPADAGVAYQTIVPSLVLITADRGGPGTPSAAPSTTPSGAASPLPSDGQGERGFGTGVVVDAAGEILTALHVVEGASRIRVRFADGTQTTARLAKSDTAKDIAVLVPDQLPQVVVPAVLGGGVSVGDPVFPVGAPFALEGTLTAGVVSALDRTIRIEGGRTLAGLIQFDAAVNPGNSGGPLLNRAGQVVGIVTGLANPAGQPYFVGVGFAVPIESAGGVAGGLAK